MADETRRVKWLGWIMIIIAVVFVAQTSINAYLRQQDTLDRRQQFQCLLDYNQASARAAELEQIRSTQDREDLVRVIRALQEERDQQLLRELQNFAENAERRNQQAGDNPPPDPENYPCVR